VWKKAGIVGAVVAAGLLAVSPLAYAGTPAERSAGLVPQQVIDPGPDGPQEGLINLGDLNVLNGVNVCPDVAAAVGVGNLLGILGIGTAPATATSGPVTCENSATATGS
jgi:hypothetical protein